MSPVYVVVGLGVALTALVSLLALAWVLHHIGSYYDDAEAKRNEIAQLNALYHAPAYDKEADRG